MAQARELELSPSVPLNAAAPIGEPVHAALSRRSIQASHETVPREVPQEIPSPVQIDSLAAGQFHRRHRLVQPGHGSLELFLGHELLMDSRKLHEPPAVPGLIEA